MNLSIDNIILIGSILLFISILAGTTSYRFGVPTLLFFLSIGMLAGSEGIGGIYFDDPKLAQFVGVIALNFILFSGGFDTRWKSVRSIISRGVVLSTLGVLITAITVGVFVWALTDFTLLEGLLLGSIVSSTDAAAVFSILRSRSVGLKSNLRPTLELESGSNDPMAYFLTITMTALIVNQNQSLLSSIPLFFLQFLIGAVTGYAMGKIIKFIINRITLGYEGLYSVLVLALMFFTFSATSFLNGNGFLAVYLSGVILGNEDVIHKRSLMKFFEGMAWLMQIVLFLTLGLLVFPSHIIPVLGVGTLIALFMIFVARPVSVFISLIFFKMKNRNRLFISWVGLRGAVPIVFATYPLIAGLEKSSIMFNIVFLITIISLILQGTTVSLAAKLFHVALPARVKRRTPVDMELADNVKSELTEIELRENSPAVGKKIVDIGLPQHALIVLIKRSDKFITPKGSTLLESGDKLLILSENEENLDEVDNMLNPV